MTETGSSRRIHILRESVVRRIAAGEVIERPASVVRELIDNSLDAASKEINLYIISGGIGGIRVVDDGVGMNAEDLELCIHPHATSKIEKSEDIYRTRSLGFRGEALSSIAACSKLDISSAPAHSSGNAHRLIVHGGKIVAMEESPLSAGTIVDVSDLFYALPGRRKFLKSAAAESSQCKSIFLEKSLAHPQTVFRLFTDEQMKLYLPAANPIDRISVAYGAQLSGYMLQEYEEQFDGFSVRAALAEPSRSRRDRRLIQIFVNGRRIQEYSLIQAVTYGYSEHLPGGSFPVAFVFIDIDPGLVDFNIHPAKREVRFKNMAEVHQALVRVVRSSLTPLPKRKVERTTLFAEAEHPERGVSYVSDSIEIERRRSGEPGERPTLPSEGGVKKDGQPSPIQHTPHLHTPYRYIGQLFSLFLLVENEERLLIIDQHAAHERVIYDRIRNQNPTIQNLLLPISITADDEQSSFLESMSPSLKRIGIDIHKKEPGLWTIGKIPQTCLGMEKELADFLKGFRGDILELEKELFAELACKAAVKDGEALDRETAVALIEEAMNLESARCPHGRPIWFELSYSELFQLVGRT